MKQLLTFAMLFLSFAALAQKGNKWMKDEKNILTVSITNKATKAELLDLKQKLWDTYQIRFDCPNMLFSKNVKKLRFLELRVEMPTEEVGTVSTNFVKPGQVIGFHYDRNPETYSIFGVWTR
jgi:hypothetical protein